METPPIAEQSRTAAPLNKPKPRKGPKSKGATPGELSPDVIDYVGAVVYRHMRGPVLSRPENTDDAKQQALLHVWANQHKWQGEADKARQKGIIAGLALSALMDWKRNDGMLSVQARIPRSRYKQWRIDTTYREQHNTSTFFSLDSCRASRGESILDYLALPPADTAWQVDALDTEQALVRLKGHLNDKQQLVLTYWLSGLTLREIGILLDFSESRASQIVTSIMEKAEWLGKMIANRQGVLSPTKSTDAELQLEKPKPERKCYTPEERKAARREWNRRYNAKKSAIKKAAKLGWHVQQPKIGE